MAFMYNNLVTLKTAMENAYSNLEVQQSRRWDLIPDLQKYVGKYMAHESETLTQIAGLRTRAMAAGAPLNEKVRLDNELQKTMGSIMVNIENYPQLKASGNMMHLQSTEVETESQIAASMRTYNSAVTSYNNAVLTIPSSIIASMFKFSRAEMLEIPEYKKENPPVSWS